MLTFFDYLSLAGSHRTLRSGYTLEAGGAMGARQFCKYTVRVLAAVNICQIYIKSDSVAIHFEG
jgi:hypothetical protein